MKQMARRAMTVLALVGLGACVNDPQENINNDDFNTLQAYPEVAFLKAGVVGGATDSNAVYFRLVNDYGNGTPTHLTLKGVTGTIRVRQDTTFRSYYTSGVPGDTTLIPYLDGHLQRWWVFTNFQPGEGTFTIAASNGVETTVRVRVEASNLGPLPTQTAILGQAITLTAPAFQKFAPDAQVTYLRGARPAKYPTYVPDTAVARAGTTTSAGAVTSVAADGSTLTFRVASDVWGKITVTKTIPTHSGLASDVAPTALATSDTLHAPGFGTVHFTDYSSGFATDTVRAVGGSFKVGGVAVTIPDVGAPVVVGLGGMPGSLGTVLGNVPLAFLLNTRIFVAGVEAGIVFNTPTSPAIGADSNSVSIYVPAHITAPAIGTIPVTATNIAFNFDPTFLFGVAAVAITATQTGNPATMVIGYLNGTSNTFTTTNYAGASTRAAAVQLPIIGFFPTAAATTRSFTINDNSAMTPLGTGDCVATNFPVVAGKTIVSCSFYKLTLETTRAIDTEIRWNTPTVADMAVYALSGTSPATTTTMKAAGTATAGGQPVLANVSVSAVNGQYVAVVLYSGAPLWRQIRITFR